MIRFRAKTSQKLAFPIGILSYIGCFYMTALAMANFEPTRYPSPESLDLECTIT